MTQVILRNLTIVSYNRGVNMWLYHAPHSRREIEGHTYWAVMIEDKAPQIAPGDFIFARHDDPTDESRVIGNSIYAMTVDGRVRRMSSTFNED